MGHHVLEIELGTSKRVATAHTGRAISLTPEITFKSSFHSLGGENRLSGLVVELPTPNYRGCSFLANRASGTGIKGVKKIQQFLWEMHSVTV